MPACVTRPRVLSERNVRDGPPKAIDQMFSYFAVVHAPRRQHPTTLHSREAILTMTIPATLGAAYNWVEIEPWGHAHQQWLSEFLDVTGLRVEGDGESSECAPGVRSAIRVA